MQLAEFIRETIRRDGPVTFAWFMEQALYHPEHGYYSSGRAAIGRGGDYFTNVSVGPLFGRLLTAQFAEMWERLGAPNEFKIVEQGAHHGDLARDVLEAARRHYPDFYDALDYQIVEPFPVLRARQEAALQEFRGKIEWCNSLEELPILRGVHFSNELVDAMPVHLVKWDGAEWKERHVTVSDDDFSFVDLPLSDPALRGRLPELPNESYETEVNLAALRWIEVLAQKLRAGFIVMVDYGWPREEFYASHRSSGTLQSYAKHRATPSPFALIGESDLTTHVEWTSLIETAEAAGLTSCGLVDQHHFIAGLLDGGVAREFETTGDAKTKRALQTLLHPEMLGRKFQYLVLAKDAGPAPMLAGLRFAKTTSPL